MLFEGGADPHAQKREGAMECLRPRRRGPTARTHCSFPSLGRRLSCDQPFHKCWVPAHDRRCHPNSYGYCDPLSAETMEQEAVEVGSAGSGPGHSTLLCVVPL